MPGLGAAARRVAREPCGISICPLQNLSPCSLAIFATLLQLIGNWKTNYTPRISFALFRAPPPSTLATLLGTVLVQNVCSSSFLVLSLFWGTFKNFFCRKPAKPATPVKKFYFGMEAEAQSEITGNGDTNEVVDKFAATLRKSAPVLSNTSPSESFSSEPTNDDVSRIQYFFRCGFKKFGSARKLPVISFSRSRN